VSVSGVRIVPQDIAALAPQVFPAVGKPTITYVERDSGAHERKLSTALKNPGQICLLTGPSKTGKTSLYRKVLPAIQRDELVVRCSGKLTTTDFWSSALENLNFERIAEKSRAWGINTTAKIGARGEVGWSWLAKAIATVGFSVSTKGDYSIKREVVRAGVSSKHLIPLLKELPVQLVIEDFHYLSEDVKKEVFQQWKAFTDEGVSVLLVSTSHHTIDIAKANRDLSGRTRFIDVGQWAVKDLARIPEKGFAFLNIKSSATVNKRIARESVGLPIIAQQICQELVVSRANAGISRAIQADDVKKVQKTVANELYSHHASDYERLRQGPRQTRRKHATYEKILASFALEPLQFSLKHQELIERVGKLRVASEAPVPVASINSALKALGKFQDRNEMSLLEWHDVERTLYIVEPSFLFYLRQKLGSSDTSDFMSRIRDLFSNIEIKGFDADVWARREIVLPAPHGDEEG
jgi:hypothetical protein